ncbi:MAG: glycosyltransferase [bacterium]|nr:glycosyltransferase [bacterium]
MAILRDTSLCAIIRDEIMNPAGGIKDFVDSTLPFVERAIIVDTGSKDGTREYLEQAKGEYPHLEVRDHPFDGYGPSRNVSIERVSTNWILILDADERIRQKDFSVLERERETHHLGHLEFAFLEVQGMEISRKVKGQLTNRFFHRDLNTKFMELVLEYASLGYNPERDFATFSKVLIYHFVPLEEAKKKKEEEWYGKGLLNPCGMYMWGKEHIPKSAPSECPSFPEWKALNPFRERYR